MMVQINGLCFVRLGNILSSVNMSGKYGWRRNSSRRRGGNNLVEQNDLHRTKTTSFTQPRHLVRPQTTITTSSHCRTKRSTSTTRISPLSSLSSSHDNDHAAGTDDERKIDEKYMRLALDEARKAYVEDEVPIGAIMTAVTGDGKETIVVATGRNAVERQQDCTRHAEMVCLQQAMKVRCAWRLHNCVLYTTLEPCAMCLSAASLARVRRIVYAARDVRLGACGSWVNLTVVKHPFHTFIDITGGVLATESVELLRRFFKRRRTQPPRYPPSSPETSS